MMRFSKKVGFLNYDELIKPYARPHATCSTTDDFLCIRPHTSQVLPLEYLLHGPTTPTLTPPSVALLVDISRAFGVTAH